MFGVAHYVGARIVPEDVVRFVDVPVVSHGLQPAVEKLI